VSKINNIVGILAASIALTGGAVTLGTAVTSTSASATTVMGGCGGGGCGGGGWGRRGNRNHNRNFNHNREFQHAREHQHQRQHLLRDFTLLVTPFQKTDNQATPWQKQDTNDRSESEDNDKNYYPKTVSKTTPPKPKEDSAPAAAVAP
jgi:hypothetical protein